MTDQSAAAAPTLEQNSDSASTGRGRRSHGNNNQNSRWNRTMPSLQMPEGVRKRATQVMTTVEIARQIEWRRNLSILQLVLHVIMIALFFAITTEAQMAYWFGIHFVNIILVRLEKGNSAETTALTAPVSLGMFLYLLNSQWYDIETTVVGQGCLVFTNVLGVVWQWKQIYQAMRSE